MGDQDSLKVATTGKVFLIKNRNVSFGVAADANKCSNDSILGYVNGPLVHKNGETVGGLIFNQKQVKNWVNPTAYSGNFAFNTGIFGCDKSGKMFLSQESKTSALTPKDIEWAIQNGPVLLKEGENPHFKNSDKRAYRTGIGYNEKNEMVVIASKKPVSMYEFAELFSLKGCKNAIYLDGEKTQGSNDYVGYKFGNNEDKMKSDRKVMMFFK